VFPDASRRDFPSLDQLAAAAMWLVRAACIQRIKITGGEPLLRPGLVELVRKLSASQLVKEVSLTTNGSRLRKFALSLKNAGLSRVNISLDTLHPERFASLCGGNVQDTLDGIDAAVQAGLSPVKLNAVLIRDSWRRDVPDLIAFAASKGLEIRFIELMPVGATADWAASHFVGAPEVIRSVINTGSIEWLPNSTGGPARRIRVTTPAGVALLGWITPESNSFCKWCDRLRLDSRGHLRRCLMDPVTLPILDLLRNECESEAIERLYIYLKNKVPPNRMRSQNQMMAMGG